MARNEVEKLRDLIDETRIREWCFAGPDRFVSDIISGEDDEEED